jgi:hypothetical protein
MDERLATTHNTGLNLRVRRCQAARLTVTREGADVRFWFGPGFRD